MRIGKQGEQYVWASRSGQNHNAVKIPTTKGVKILLSVNEKIRKAKQIIVESSSIVDSLVPNPRR
jgi:hypothetical protein